MVRWQEGATERLQMAALELFTSRGFEQTTAADIAAAVGLTERTFFRHFADKREVLFHGQDRFVQVFVDAIGDAAIDATPLEVVAGALSAGAALFPDERRPHSRARASIIAANPALQERERHKFAGLAQQVAQALADRGMQELDASLAAESGATVFGISFSQWMRDGETRSLSEISVDVLGRLQQLAGSGRPAQ